MAYGDDGPRNFYSEQRMVEGTVVADPRNISGTGKITCAVFRIAADYRVQGEKDSFYYDVKVLGDAGDNALESFNKGDRVFAFGGVEGRKWDDKETGNERHEATINATIFGASTRFNTVTVNRRERDDNGGGSARRSSSESTSSRRSSASADEDGGSERTSSRRSSRRGVTESGDAQDD